MIEPHKCVHRGGISNLPSTIFANASCEKKEGGSALSKVQLRGWVDSEEGIMKIEK